MLNVATFFKTTAHVAFLLWHSIKESCIGMPFNGMLHNGALVETGIQVTAYRPWASRANPAPLGDF